MAPERVSSHRPLCWTNSNVGDDSTSKEQSEKARVAKAGIESRSESAGKTGIHRTHFSGTQARDDPAKWIDDGGDACIRCAGNRQALFDGPYPRRQQVLRDKGFGLLAEDGYDFLTYDVGLWPRIIQNPPFEEGQDVDHVRRAYECLESGGVLVSVMSASPFFRDDSKSRLFRQWLDRQDSQVIDLEQGAFKESGTGVKAKMVVIHKSPMSRGDPQMRLL